VSVGSSLQSLMLPLVVLFISRWKFASITNVTTTCIVHLVRKPSVLARFPCLFHDLRWKCVHGSKRPVRNIGPCWRPCDSTLDAFFNHPIFPFLSNSILEGLVHSDWLQNRCTANAKTFRPAVLFLPRSKHIVASPSQDASCGLC
jgi:hypothetical protein